MIAHQAGETSQARAAEIVRKPPSGAEVVRPGS
jgi:hypothetical protein